MNRNFGLDLMRAISIWMVLAQHGGINIPGLRPLRIGGIGVEIFFVLSGFLIGGILFKEIDKKMPLGKTLKTFWTRRWFRILPLYYLVILFKFIIIDHSIGYNIIYYLLFLQNNFYGIHFFGVSWSLVIEEWFYLFAPFYLMFATNFLKTERKIFLAIISFIVFVNIARFGYVLNGNVPYEGVNSNFPFRFDSLFLGVLLAFMKHKKWVLFEKLKSPIFAITGLALFIAYIYYYWTLAYPNQLIDSQIFPRTIGFFILPFTVALTVPFISSINYNQHKNIFTKSFYELITYTSVLTYAIYLIHTFIFPVILEHPKITSVPLQWAIALILTYLISWVVYQTFEKPILNYRDKITSKS
jgi:peptidoglycan/LPS O-acetylase OafA/YrhL